MNKLTNFCEKIIEYSIIATVILIPLFISTYTVNSISLPKTAIFRTLVIIMFCAWLIKLVEIRQKDFYKIKFAIPILLVFLTMIIATIFSLDPKLSLWGFGYRFNGLFTFMFYVLFFFITTNYFIDTNFKTIKKIINYLIFTSALISVYGIMQHFNLEIISQWVGQTQDRITATLGNALQLSSYLTMLIPLTFAWIITSKKNKEKIYFSLILVLQLITLLFTQTRSAWLAFLISGFSCLLLYCFKNKKKLLGISALSAGLLLVIITIGIILPNSPLNNLNQNKYINRFTSSFTVQDSSSQARLIIMQSAWQAIKNQPIFGHGPNTFNIGYNMNFIPELINYDLQEYDSSHNLFLDWTYANGFLGLTALLFLIIYFFLHSLKKYFSEQDKFNNWLRLALLSSLIAFMVQSQFGLPYLTIFVLFFLYLSMISALSKDITEIDNKIIEIKKTKLDLAIYILIILAGLVIIIKINFMPFMANHYYQVALNQQTFEQRQIFINKTLNLNGPFYSIEYQEMNISDHFDLAKYYAQNNEPQKSEEFFEKAAGLTNELINQHPNYAFSYITLANIYSQWAISENFDNEKIQLSDQYFAQALQLFPNKQVFYWDWSLACEGQDRLEIAEEKLQQAINLAPTVKKSYQKLSAFYKKTGDLEASREILKTYQQLNEK